MVLACLCFHTARAEPKATNSTPGSITNIQSSTANPLPQTASEEEVEVLEASIRTNNYPSLVKSHALSKFQVALESARNLRRAPRVEACGERLNSTGRGPRA